MNRRDREGAGKKETPGLLLFSLHYYFTLVGVGEGRLDVDSYTFDFELHSHNILNMIR